MKPFSYAPDVEQRKTLDNGFSMGWGMHFPACEDFWFDAHVHYGDADGQNAKIDEVLEGYAPVLEEHRVLKSMVIFKTYDPKTGWIPPNAENKNFFPIRQIAKYADYFHANRRFFWAAWMGHKDPNAALLRQCVDAGASCIKLHNAPIITEAGDPNIWNSQPWRDVFERIGESGLPVLWHVTQRLSACPYRGMGANSYWKEGVPKGVAYTNQDLLSLFLETVERYPQIHFIGAHQLHLGFDRLGALFDRYPNLSVDTSIGCFLKPDDCFHEPDREYIRDFLTRYGDRILFATDVYYRNPKDLPWKLKEEYLGHIRFIKKLNLPDGALQAISHGNAEKRFFARKDAARKDAAR